MSAVTVCAPAKVNLFLHVTGKREDGYHLLESLIVFTDFGDRLDILPDDQLSLAVTGPMASALADDQGENLVLRAARGIGGGRGARLLLHKAIPVGAGLGGGSSDAAAALRGLADLWGMYPPEQEFHHMALALGSDVPVCMRAQPSWVEGTGDKVEPVPMAASPWLVLVNPGIHLLTADVFRRFGGAFEAPTQKPGSLDTVGELAAFLAARRNSLEAPAISLVPEIGELLAAIAATPGCLLSRMSGSGATCFGLYDNLRQASAAAEQLQNARPHWWVTVTRLYGKTQ